MATDAGQLTSRPGAVGPVVPPAVQTRGLNRGFDGRTVLDDVDLDITTCCAPSASEPC